MYQYVFVHQDVNGGWWKHIHFSLEAANSARLWWGSLKYITAFCSSIVVKQERKVSTPRIVGMNVSATIEIEEPSYEKNQFNVRGISR